MALLIVPREDGQCTKNNVPDVSILLDWKWCHWVDKVVAFLYTGDKEALVSPFSKRYSLSSSRLWPRHRPSNEREEPQRMQVARAVAHGPQRPALRKKRSLAADRVALPRRTQDVIETFAALAEGAILGTSIDKTHCYLVLHPVEWTACTFASVACCSCLRCLSLMSTLHMYNF